MRIPRPTAERLSLGSPLVAGLAIVTAALLGVSAGRISFRAWTIEGERDALESRIRELEVEKQRLQESIAQAETPETVERLAKERLNLKRPGEEVVVVTPPTQPPQPPPPPYLARFIPSWLGELLDFFQR